MASDDLGADDASAEEGGPSEPRPAPRRRKRGSPTIIGMAVAKPAEKISPPKGSPAAPRSPARSLARDGPPPAKPFPARKGVPIPGGKPGGSPLPKRNRPAHDPARQTVADDPDALALKATMEAPAPEIPPLDELAEPASAPAEAPGSDEVDTSETATPDEPLEDLPGEPTSVTASPEPDGATDAASAPAPLPGEPTRPQVGADEIAYEPTRPAAVAPEPSPQDPAPDPALPAAEDLPVSPTVVVDQAALQQQQEQHRLQSGSRAAGTESGEAPLPAEPPASAEPMPPSVTYVVDEPPKRSSAGLVIGVVAGALLLLSALGVGVYFLVFRAGGTDDPNATGAPADDDPSATPAITPPSGPVEVEGEGEEDEEPPEDDEGTAGARGTGSSAVVDLETLEGAEADPPATSRRARRMNEAQRRRMASRLRHRALQRYRAEDWEEAERLYREALTYNSWDVAAVEGVARSLAQRERYPLALAWANLAVERNPRSGTAYRVVGDVYRQAGHPEQALRAYRRGLRRQPEDRWLRRRVRELREDIR